jgi:hypothetical protein
VWGYVTWRGRGPGYAGGCGRLYGVVVRQVTGPRLSVVVVLYGEV